MVSLCCETSMMPADLSKAPCLYYTDIYQRYQFCYPSTWTIVRQERSVRIQYERTPGHALPVAPSDSGQMVIFKPQPFHDLINLEEYLEYKDRQLGFQRAIRRSAISDLLPGYRGIREIISQANGIVHSYIYMSCQARMMRIFAVISEGLDTDIKLAHSVRFL